MWGSWYTVVFAGLGAALLLIALAFGMGAGFFAVLIAGAIGVVIAIAIGMRRSGQRAGQEGSSRTRSPLSEGAPAAGEGSESPPSRTGPHLPESGVPPT